MKLLTFCFLVLVSGLADAQSSTAPAPSANQSAAGEKPQLLWKKFEQTIQRADAELDGVLGVAVLDLTTGQTYFYNADELFPTASSIKIALLAELYRQNQSGSGAKLSDVYVVRKEDLVPDSSIMGGLTPGVTRLTNRDLATMVVAVSDNSATNVLIDRVGMANVNAMLDSLGLHRVRLQRKMMDLRAAGEGRENIATPREMMQLLQAIFGSEGSGRRGKLLNKAGSDDLLALLSTTKDSPMRHALAEEVRVADKPGELEAVRNDSGIIYATNRPFVLSVMTTYLKRERDGEEAIQKITRAAWEMFERLGRASEYGRVVSPGNSSK
jgi:beta-lactamase class A